MKKRPGTITFSVPAIPIAQPRQRHAMRGKFIHNYTPSKHPVQDFKASVRMAAAKVYRGQPIDAPIMLSVWFYLPRPKRLIWKNKPMPSVPHTGKPDLDNLVKSFKDALSGLLWRDDSLICELVATKYYVPGDAQPEVLAMLKIDWGQDD